MNSAAGSALCRSEDIPENGVLAVEAVSADGTLENLIVCRAGGAIRAYLNICPHAGRRLDWAPGKFLLKNGQMVCAVHGASFALADGHCVAGPCRGQSLRAVALREQDGVLWLA